MTDPHVVLRTYFEGEKSEAMLILLAGILCLAGAIALWLAVREPFAKGLAAALLLAAVLGLGVGGSVYFRTDNQLQQLSRLQKEEPARFAAEEGPRIRQVVRSFALYRYAYALAVLVALALVFVVRGALYQGIAVGLLLLAALGLTIDFYAERRAVEYVDALVAARALTPPA
jgi:hypothetical protein